VWLFLHSTTEPSGRIEKNITESTTFVKHGG
jgi:hypothetical protein